MKAITKRQRDGIVKRIDRHKAIIAKSRDELRSIYEDLESVLDSADVGLELLDDAVTTLSQYV